MTYGSCVFSSNLINMNPESPRLAAESSFYSKMQMEAVALPGWDVWENPSFKTSVGVNLFWILLLSFEE